MPPAAVDDLVYESSTARFLKLCLPLLLVEVPLVYTAITRAQTLPIKGDPTLRYVSIGVPTLWSLVIPAMVLAIYLSQRAQTLTISSKAVIVRRGNLTTVLNYHGAIYQPSQERRFDAQCSIITKSRAVVIRSLFFPQFAEIERELNRRFQAPKDTDYRV
jgi:hypothetical protein